MSATQWVQHISGQGEKWEVRDGVTASHQWCVKTHGEIGYHWLPKFEYHLCDPPEEWVDVTGECIANNKCALSLHHRGRVCTSGGEMFPWIYRLRKVALGDLIDNACSHSKPVFIVEKKVSE